MILDLQQHIRHLRPFNILALSPNVLRTSYLEVVHPVKEEVGTSKEVVLPVKEDVLGCHSGTRHM